MMWSGLRNRNVTECKELVSWLLRWVGCYVTYLALKKKKNLIWHILIFLKLVYECGVHVWCMCTCICTQAHENKDIGGPLSFSASLFLWHSASLSLELVWQPANPQLWSSSISLHSSGVRGMSFRWELGCKLRSSCFCSKCSYLPHHLSSSSDF